MVEKKKTIESETLEQISAQIDGALSPDASRALDERIAAEPALRAARRGAVAADGAFRAALAETPPAPQAAIDAVRTTFAARRRRARGRSILAVAAPLAASLAVIVGGGFWLENRVAEITARQQAETMRLLETAFQNALESAVSGSEIKAASGDGNYAVSIKPNRTYRSASSHWCREFSVKIVENDLALERQGVACRDDGGVWRRTDSDKI